jgi:hypothetical protein
MSDKGREGIAEKLREDDIRKCPSYCKEDTPCMACVEADEEAAELIKVLRQLGWLHEDDVVEGREAPDKLCPCKLTEEHVCNNEKAIQLDIDCNDYNEDCFSMRPAKVKDLIKKEG